MWNFDADRTDCRDRGMRRVRRCIRAASLRRAQVGSCRRAAWRGRTRDGVGWPDLAFDVRGRADGVVHPGHVLDAVGFAGSAISARLIPLFLSQTVVSANLVITAVLGGTVVLGIQLHRRDWFAIAAVIGSLLLLGLSSGHAGGGSSNDVVHWGVLVGSALILLIGIGLIRWLGSRAAVVAGLISGVLFGCLAIAVRVVYGIDPFEIGTMLRDPAGWAILVSGLGGFYLHTVALQLGSVNGATAALVVGETVVPGIVGVVVLGDASRPGLEWLAVVGFVGGNRGCRRRGRLRRGEPRGETGRRSDRLMR